MIPGFGMWMSRLFWRMFAVHAGMVVFSAVVLGVVLSRSPVQGGAAPLTLWGACCLLIAGELALTSWLVGRVIRPLNQLTAAARQIAAGHPPEALPIHQRSEIGELAQAIDSMNRQLATRIDDLQDQSLKLRHNNEQLETVLGAMVEGVIAVDREQRVLLANDAAFRLLDLPRTSVVGRPLWEAVRQAQLQELVRRALQGETTERVEFPVSRAQHIVSVAASCLPGAPCPGAVLVLHDVSELRRLEQLRREFVANVSHELKTPLTSIAAYTETLLDGALEDPPHNREFLKRIGEQTERLQALIVDLLSLARMEADETQYELTTVNAADVLESSVEAHRAVAEGKRIRLDYVSGNELPDVLADADGLRTIFDNLLDNALNYTPHDGQVTVAWRADGDWLEIDVQDTGVGIAKEHQARIFERFFRVDRARSREVGGTGLGLSIVKHLCQVFGGSVSVTSQLQQGSTFTVRLKRAMSTAT